MAACIYSPLIKSPNRVSNDFMYVSDVLATLAGVANIKIDDNSLDSINLWETISSGAPSGRKEVLYNIENVRGYSALVHDGWKLVNGSENINNSNWFGRSGLEDVVVSFKSYAKDVVESEASRSLPTLNLESVKRMRDEATVKCNAGTRTTECNPLVAPCVFNIIDDPCETNNLADSHPAKLDFLVSRLNKHIDEIYTNQRKPSDPKCDPKNFNYTWTWWQDEEIEDNGGNVYVYVSCLVVLAAVSFFLIARCNKSSSHRK